MTLHKERRIGRLSVLLLLNEAEERTQVEELERDGWKVCLGKVGSMDAHKVVAAIETASKKSGVIQSEGYRESHALYHATMEALHGVTRGEMLLGSLLRTVGLRFAVLRGNPYESEAEGDWIAVSLYGTIGAPIKGLEHETFGVGINHI
ncbi:MULTISPECIES: hut operon transcriptional regulator HutP [Bacillus]|jgi:hut operon positive regulator|uniref:Hut operon positive regulatory protein n=1 Tax=Bacillus mojavensis TaxID=72360 RepID=A0AAP3G0F3_BACMO|nr:MULTISPECIES: hut operon transcriptional regulator HutP [Bacillus]OIS57078.1 transcriptional regulator [Bacillus subtilis]MCB7154403.1 hut operon transcriptional regulator HutP [Bacillus stercoris]MCC2929953.1 hut operon transcriptional regulator HutP [Bacillus sp. LBG-1-113]MCY8508537.1 hut operon transcriptional regulator HutP [Bacillus mojavensis]MCY9089692.1 hut operon transcriptional regulator HutP [Bacillus mojavensis]